MIAAAIAGFTTGFVAGVITMTLFRSMDGQRAMWYAEEAANLRLKNRQLFLRIEQLEREAGESP